MPDIMNILVASDSFKGTMSSPEIGRIVREELSSRHRVDWLPVSDGGEGFLDAWRDFHPGQSVSCRSRDPLGREITCEYILIPDKTAIIESAVTIGLSLLTESERNPMKTSSYGLRLLILDAWRRGADKVYAVCDVDNPLLGPTGQRWYTGRRKAPGRPWWRSWKSE